MLRLVEERQPDLLQVDQPRREAAVAFRHLVDPPRHMDPDPARPGAGDDDGEFERHGRSPLCLCPQPDSPRSPRAQRFIWKVPRAVISTPRRATFALPTARTAMPANRKAQIERINQVSAMARTSWITLLGYLAFICVTLLGVEDADFFLPSRQTRLPLIDVSIPTTSFFVFAPILAAALYVYLHIILLKLWDAFADLTDPTFEGQRVGDALVPWLVNDWALTLKGGAYTPDGPLRALGNLASLLPSSGARPLPFSPASGGAPCPPTHPPLLSLLLAGCFIVSLATAIIAWQTARAWLTGHSDIARPSPVLRDPPPPKPRAAADHRRAQLCPRAPHIAPPLRRHLGPRRRPRLDHPRPHRLAQRRRTPARPRRRFRGRDGRLARQLARLGKRTDRLPRSVVQA